MITFARKSRSHSPRRRYLLPAGLLTAALAVPSAPAPALAQAGHAPADRAGAQPGWLNHLHWTSVSPGRGVTLRTGTLANSGSHPFWTVTIGATVTSSLTGQPARAELGTPAWADRVAAQLQADGYPARLDTIPWPGYTDTPHGSEGVRVRTGDYPTQQAAQAAATALHGLGFSTAAAEWTGYDSGTAPDGERIHEAIIDPHRFPGTVEVTHHGVLAQRQTTSSVSAALHAAVAVNAGFFITSGADGYQGAPTGLAVYDGQLESMNNGPRAALIFGDGPPHTAQLTATVTVRSGGSAYPVEGINRLPGVVQDCGRPDSVPVSQPRQDITCTSTSELVLFTSQLGAATPTGSGSQAVLDSRGIVTAAGARGGTVPAGGSIIQGIGSAAAWLARHAHAGQRLAISEQVRDTAGHSVPLHPGVSIASAAPTLLRGGRPAIDAATEGVIDPADLSFNYAWAEIRQPRTMAGIDSSGRLLLVTADGREPGISEGLTLTEEASLMRSLGAVDAMNLDGGGSTAIATGGTLLNHPSDPAGERADGDFVVAVPPAQR